VRTGLPDAATQSGQGRRDSVASVDGPFRARAPPVLAAQGSWMYFRSEASLPGRGVLRGLGVLREPGCPVQGGVPCRAGVTFVRPSASRAHLSAPTFPGADAFLCAPPFLCAHAFLVRTRASTFPRMSTFPCARLTLTAGLLERRIPDGAVAAVTRRWGQPLSWDSRGRYDSDHFDVRRLIY
jgi:hypothetical protein